MYGGIKKKNEIKGPYQREEIKSGYLNQFHKCSEYVSHKLTSKPLPDFLFILFFFHLLWLYSL